jgi:nucleoside-diphosphate-sugar epimerase
MKKVLVTGGLGFIGSNLVEKLKKEVSVVVVDNLSSSRDDWPEIVEKNKEVEYVKTCFSSTDIKKRIESQEFDVIFHIAAVPRVGYSVENPSETTDINVGKTISLIESSNIGSVSRFIFSSSSSVYGSAEKLPTPASLKKEPQSPYAWQKSCVEDFIKMSSTLYDMDGVSLRYFNVFGPGQFGGSSYATAVSAWCNAVKTGASLRSDGTGDQTRDMCYIDNVVEANILAMKAKKTFQGQCYNVACGDSVSNNEILKAFLERFPNIEIKNAPFRKGDVMHTMADINDTKRDLGYQPSVRFWKGLEHTFDWWGLNK